MSDKKDCNITEDDIICAIKKKALGYDYDEIVEDYSIGENGETILSKRKITKKYVPADITCAKLLLSMINSDEYNFQDMSDEQLINEKNRLLEIIEKGESENDS